jgi:hypothetical protein
MKAARMKQSKRSQGSWRVHLLLSGMEVDLSACCNAPPATARYISRKVMRVTSLPYISTRTNALFGVFK